MFVTFLLCKTFSFYSQLLKLGGDLKWNLGLAKTGPGIMRRGRRAECSLSYFTLAVTFVGYRGRQKQQEEIWSAIREANETELKGEL